MSTPDFFRSRLDAMIDLRHPLKGQTGDALHAVLCATGYNLRWLLRAIVRLGLGPIFFILSWLHWTVNVSSHPLLAHRALPAA